MEMWNIPTVVAHETYPGHHAEHAIKENRLYIGEGHPEHSIVLLNTPSSLISEGIAANALLVVASEAEISEHFSDCSRNPQLPRSFAGSRRRRAEAEPRQIQKEVFS
jgi:hypothetical protein